MIEQLHEQAKRTIPDAFKKQPDYDEDAVVKWMLGSPEYKALKEKFFREAFPSYLETYIIEHLKMTPKSILTIYMVYLAEATLSKEELQQFSSPIRDLDEEARTVQCVRKKVSEFMEDHAEFLQAGEMDLGAFMLKVQEDGKNHITIKDP